MSARTRVGRAFTSVYKRLGEKVGGCMATGWAVAAGDREAGSDGAVVCNSDATMAHWGHPQGERLRGLSLKAGPIWAGWRGSGPDGCRRPGGG